MSMIYVYVVIDVQLLFVLFEFQCCVLCDFDVQIDVFYCGVCYLDFYQVCNEWCNMIYLVVFGYEIVGCVIVIGLQVLCFKVGELVGVGCFVDLCCICVSCEEGFEQYCENGFVGIYNGQDCVMGDIMYGGYLMQFVVDEVFVLCVLDMFDLVGVVLLLCVGIMIYLLLWQWNVGFGKKVGIVGFGGFGYMGVKLVCVMGVYVVLFMMLLLKIEDGKWFGVYEVVILKDEVQMNVYLNSFDFILNMVVVQYDLNLFLYLFKCDGMMMFVGVLEYDYLLLQVFNLIFKCCCFVGLLIGGIVEMQEMFDFCVEYGIMFDIEMILMQQINMVYEWMLKSDVKYWFVIDMVLFKQ